MGLGNAIATFSELLPDATGWHSMACPAFTAWRSIVRSVARPKVENYIGSLTDSSPARLDAGASRLQAIPPFP